MRQMSFVKRSMLAAACIALCVVLPMAFHAVPNAGAIFLPMHIPVLLCGLLCSWPFGLLCGLAGPLLSSLLTGMPPIAYLPPMLVELALYGLLTGLGMRVFRTKRVLPDLYLSLLFALLLGRFAAGAARALLFAPGSYSLAVWASAYFTVCLPGLVIQLLFIPGIVYALMKAGLVPARYPAQGGRHGQA